MDEKQIDIDWTINDYSNYFSEKEFVLLPQVQIFPNGQSLVQQKFFDLEIHDPKTHMSDISHKVMRVHERLDVGNRQDACL